jgi:hypothetical protein
MTGMADHRKTGTTSDVKAAWAVVIAMGGTSVTYQIFHAVVYGQMNLYLAILYGLVPTAVAALLSHIVATHKGGWMLQALTFAVMLGAMALSVNSTGAVVHTAAGKLWWLFGLVLDAAALISLRVILSAHERKRDEATALEGAEQAAREALTRAQQADVERARHAADAEQLRVELAAANATAEALKAARVPARKPRRSSARKPATSSGRNRTAASAPEPAQVPGGSSGPGDELDLDTEALILKYIDEGYSASKAGVMAGASDSYGRHIGRLRKAAKQEPAGDERTEGDVQ